MEFIGQDRILKLINSYSISTLPKSMLFIGESGCGKHTLANLISSNLGLNIVKIDSKITKDQLIDYYQSPIETLYLIDLANFTDKQQNQFLKFIEEPSDYAYIIIIAESEAGILPTVLNRCVKFEFEKYTKDQLSIFLETDNELVYKICNTPGQLKMADSESINNLFNLCSVVVKRLPAASYANTLTIASKINHKEEYNKFDQDMFLKMLSYVAFNEYINTNSTHALTIYQIVNNFKQAKLNKNIVKENYVLNLLTQLWEAVH
jgi:replication-associated recombination protein RarA